MSVGFQAGRALAGPASIKRNARPRVARQARKAKDDAVLISTYPVGWSPTHYDSISHCVRRRLLSTTLLGIVARTLILRHQPPSGRARQRPFTLVLAAPLLPTDRQIVRSDRRLPERLVVDLQLDATGAEQTTTLALVKVEA